MFPLALLSPGDRARISRLAPPPTGTSSSADRTPPWHRLESMGLRVGAEVEVVSGGRSDALLLRVDETRIALGRGVAMRIFVERRPT
ncbi:FeoA family protein [Deferrisoma sp.]